MFNKIAFVIPPFIGGRYFLQPPLASLWTISLLKQNNIESDLYDLRLEKNYHHLLKSLQSGYRYIIFCTSELDILQNYPVDYRLQYALSLCKKIKQNTLADIIVVGAHGSILPDLILKETNADYVVRGEWELAVTDFIISKNKSSSRIIDGKSGLMQTSCIPDFSVIDLTKYYGYSIRTNDNIIINNWSVVQASRGCPFSCKFCYNFYGKKMSYRDPQIVYKDIKNQVMAGAKIIFFLDSIFGLNRKNVEKLCHLLIDNPLDVDLIVQTRAGVLDDSILALMKKAGFIGVWFGIESFNDDVLMGSDKKNSSHNNIDAINLVKSAGIIPAAFMMQGLPNQSADMVRDDLEFLSSLGVRYNLSTLLLRPGSDLYNEYLGNYNSLCRPWHLPLLFKGSSLIGESSSKMMRVHTKYSRKRVSSIEVSKSGKNYYFAIVVDINHDCFDDCYQIINFVENNRKVGANIKVHLLCEKFFDHPYLEEIIKYLNDADVSSLIITNLNCASKHKAILSTIKSNLKILPFNSNLNGNDYDLLFNLGLISDVDMGINNYKSLFLFVKNGKFEYNDVMYLGENHDC